MTSHFPTGQPPWDDPDSGAAAPSTDEAAALWLVRMTSGETTPEDHAEFARWRSESPDHEAALAALRSLWVGLGPLLDERALPAPSPEIANRVEARRPAATRRRRARLWALAASLAMGVTLGYQALTNWSHDEVTVAGERRSVTLADGSQVMLNGASALDIHLDSALREVVISRGEAFFEVTHDAARPFVVRAGEAQVRVLGTRFAVRRDGEDLRVTLQDGVVEVTRGGAMAILSSSQQVSAGPQGLSGIAAANPERDLSWRSGRLILQDQALSDIVAELNRCSSDSIWIANEEAGKRRLSAVIDLDQVDDWLEGLEQTASVTVTRLGPLVVIR
ncbi:MAG: FecR family protein [Panacagrimonas sp.]